jgi:integrase
MTTAAFHTTHSLRHYFTDLGNAARAFAAALFAAQERQFVVQEVMAPALVSERARARTHMKLIRMANDYQDMQPSLAAELRQLASRG